MNIKIKKTDTTNMEAVDFLAFENLKLFLKVSNNPNIKRLYESNHKEVFIETFISKYKETLNGGTIYTAHIEDKIIGVAYIKDNNYLESLFVSEEYRNIGIGSKLLKTLIEECSKLGAIRVDANLEAVSLYERFDFKRVDGQIKARVVPMELGEIKHGK